MRVKKAHSHILLTTTIFFLFRLHFFLGIELVTAWFLGFISLLTRKIREKNMTNEQQPPPAVPQQQQQPVNNPQNADGNATNDDPLTPITLLLRFLYTGTTAASIPVKSTAAPDLRSMADKLNCIIDMATAQPNLPVSTIRKVNHSFFSEFPLNDFLLIFCLLVCHSLRCTKQKCTFVSMKFSLRWHSVLGKCIRSR